MSLDLAFGIARTGLLATQRALADVSQNIANARTEGYTRKAAQPEAASFAGQGMGVRLGAAARSVDAALVGERNARASDAAAAEARERLLAGVEAAHGTPGGGDTLGDAIAAMGDAFLALGASPADPGLQRQAVSEARLVAARFNEVAQAVGDARSQAQSGIAQGVREANAALRQVAALSAQIIAARGSGASSAALEDQRDAAIAALAKHLPVRAIPQADGGVTLLSGSVTLPLDARRDVLSFDEAAIGPNTWHGAGGTLPGVMLDGRDITRMIGGGAIGALAGLRDEVLPRFQAELDLAAGNLTRRMRAEGLRMFSDATGAVPSMAQPYSNPASGQIGFANRIQVNPAVLATPSLVRDGTQVVTASPGGPTAFTPNPPGGPAGFDTLIRRITDHALGATSSGGTAWPAIPTSGLGPDGSLSSPFMSQGAVQGFAAALTGAQVAARAEASAALERADVLRSGLDARLAAESGVDTDTEMAAMVQLQNAYAANARVMTTAQEMFDLLFSIGR